MLPNARLRSPAQRRDQKLRIVRSFLTSGYLESSSDSRDASLTGLREVAWPTATKIFLRITCTCLTCRRSLKYIDVSNLLSAKMIQSAPDKHLADACSLVANSENERQKSHRLVRLKSAVYTIDITYTLTTRIKLCTTPS